MEKRKGIMVVIVLSILLTVAIATGLVIAIKYDKSIKEFEHQNKVIKNVLSAVQDENDDYKLRNQALRDSFTELDEVYQDAIDVLLDFTSELDYYESDYNYWVAMTFSDSAERVGDRYLEVTGRKEAGDEIDYWEIEQ